jgi:hypothetical protein
MLPTRGLRARERCVAWSAPHPTLSGPIDSVAWQEGQPAPVINVAPVNQSEAGGLLISSDFSVQNNRPCMLLAGTGRFGSIDVCFHRCTRRVSSKFVEKHTALIIAVAPLHARNGFVPCRRSRLFFFLLLFLSHAIATRADFPCAYIHTHRLLIVRGLTRQLQPPSPCASFWKSGNSLLLERSKRQLLLVQHLTSPSLISSIFIATKISPGHESCYIYQTRKRLI